MANTRLTKFFFSYFSMIGIVEVKYWRYLVKKKKKKNRIKMPPNHETSGRISSITGMPSLLGEGVTQYKNYRLMKDSGLSSDRPLDLPLDNTLSKHV